MASQHADLIICTPGHSVMSGYLRSLLETTQELNNRGITWAFSNEYSSHVGDARETTLSGTKQNSLDDSRPFHGNLTYNKLIWIDSDISWTVDDFMKIYESDKDIISGAYLLGNGDVTAYKEQLGRPYTYGEVLEMTEPTVVSGVGFGFLGVKKGVFESISRPWFQATEATLKNLDTKEEFSFMIMGEDIAWCKRVQDAGFKIWFDPTVRVQHHKMMKLTWEGPKP